MRRSLLLLVVLAACGGGDDSNKAVDAATHKDAPLAKDAPETHDATKPIDATPATVENVSCSNATPTATVTASGEGTSGVYKSTPAGSSSNDSAIKVGDVVEFDLVPTTTHPVQPFAAGGMTDPGIVAPDDAITCLKFTAVGTFHYDCSIHGPAVNGTVTVTN